MLFKIYISASVGFFVLSPNLGQFNIGSRCFLILTNTPGGYIFRPGVMQMSGECCCRTKKRSEEEYKKLANRLKRIEGQIRGLESMLDKDAYCTDILVQVTAVNAALNAFSKELLANHIKSCVVDDIKAGKEETVDDLLSTLQKLMK